MEFGVNSYDGPGAAMPGSGSSPAPKRDGVRRSHREIMRKFQDNGNQALNAADYEATMSLPIKQRKACDRETGDFDPDAPRPAYNPAAHSKYPMQVHSTVTEGEFILVNSEVEHKVAISTGKWSDKPLERKKRFTLTPDAQMENMQAQIIAERARNIQFENRLEEMARANQESVIVTQVSEVEMLKQQMAEQREEYDRKMAAFEARFGNVGVVSAPEDDGEDDGAEELVSTASKSRRR